MAITFTPEVKFFHHQLGSVPGLSFLANVNSEGTWYVHNDPSMIFTFNGENIPEIHGSGSTDVQIKMTNAVNDFDEGIYELHLRAFSSDGTEEALMTVYLLCTVADDDVVLPKNLRFEAVRNVKNADEQQFFIATGQSGITINLPSWLTLVSHELNGGGHIVTVKPVAQGTTPNPEYNDEIEVLIPGEPASNISVTYHIHAGYDPSYTRSVHFTRDNDELVFWQTTPEKSFLRLSINVKSFDDKDSSFRDFNLLLDLPFIENQAKINIGKEIEAYLFEDIQFNSAMKTAGCYPPLELRITAMEIKYDDFSILNQDILPLQYYLAGRNPLSIRNNNLPFWCNSRPSILRMVSAEAVASLSIFKPAKTAIKNFTMKKNGVFEKFITPINQTFGQMRPYFATVNVDMSKINLAPGDVISFEYDGISLNRKFIIRPNVKESVMIAFRTEFYTLELVEFTGIRSFEIEYQHELTEAVKNYVTKNRKNNTTKIQKLIANTGWIRKEETFVIDELISAKSALLIKNTPQFTAPMYSFENLEHVELIPVQSKITNYNSDNNNVQLDVEFIINPKYDYQIFA